MNLTIWTSFSKKKNSTAHPVINTGATITCVLKEGTNILHPTFILNASTAPTIKYAYVSDFGRFYFVDSIVYLTGSQWEVNLTVDPLASFMTPIGNYEGLILRCSDTSFYNPLIRDDFNQATETVAIGTASSSAQGIFSGASYILSLASQPPGTGASASQNGFFRSYAILPSTMAQLAINLFDTNLWTQIKQQLSDPMSAIIDCRYLPIAITNMHTATERMKFGDYSSGLDGNVLTNRFYSSSIQSLSLPVREWLTDTYAEGAPYLTMTMYLPFVGVVPLDIAYVRSNWTLYFQIHVDLCTGDVVYKIFSDSAGNRLAATYSGNCSSECPVSNKGFNAIGQVGGIATMIGGAAATVAAVATGGAALPAVAAIGGGFGAAAVSSEVHTQTNGAVSSALGQYVGSSIQVTAYKKTPAHGLTDSYYVTGLPCNKVATIKNHAGYLVMQSPSIAIDGTDSERDMINDYLANGFFYE